MMTYLALSSFFELGALYVLHILNQMILPFSLEQGLPNICLHVIYIYFSNTNAHIVIKGKGVSEYKWHTTFEIFGIH